MVRAESWPMVGHDPGFSSSTTDVLPQSLLPRWTNDLPESAVAVGMAQFDRTLIVVGTTAPTDDGSQTGKLLLCAYDAVSGSQLWKTKIGEGEAAPPAMSDRRAYVNHVDPQGNGHLSAYSLQDGSLLWQVSAETGGKPHPPLLYDAEVWLPGAEGRILQWRDDTGDPLAGVETGLVAPAGYPQALSSIALTELGTVAAAWADRVYSAPVEDDAWTKSVPGEIALPLAVSGSQFFVPVKTKNPNESGLRVLNLFTGRQAWSLAGEPSTLAANGDRAVVGTVDGVFAAFDPYTGFRLNDPWIGATRLSGAVLAGNTAIFGDGKGVIHELSADESELWHFPTFSAGDRNDLWFQNAVARVPNDAGTSETLLYSLRSDGLLLAFGEGRYGDLNGDGQINVGDAILGLRAAVGVVILSPSAAVAADVAPIPGSGRRPMGDGKVDLKDVVSLLHRAVGLESSDWPFPG